MIDRAQVFIIMIVFFSHFVDFHEPITPIMNIDFVKVARQLKADGVVQVGKELCDF